MNLMKKSDLKGSLEGREKLYSFLGRICEKEMDEQMLKDIITRKELFLKYNLIAEADAEDLLDGFRDLHNYLIKINEKDLSKAISDLAVDYANLFLGVGYAYGKGIIHPSESAYLKGYLYSDIVDELFEEFLEEGLIKSPDFKEPEDHIALELYFMAHLCRKAIISLDSGRYRDLLKYFNKQKTFMVEHLLKWAPNLAKDMIEYANTLFYKAVGKLMRGFLSIEEKIIDELIEQAKALVQSSS